MEHFEKKVFQKQEELVPSSQTPCQEAAALLTLGDFETAFSIVGELVCSGDLHSAELLPLLPSLVKALTYDVEEDGQGAEEFFDYGGTVIKKMSGEQDDSWSTAVSPGACGGGAPLEVRRPKKFVARIRKFLETVFENSDKTPLEIVAWLAKRSTSALSPALAEQLPIRLFPLTGANATAEASQYDNLGGGCGNPGCKGCGRGPSSIRPPAPVAKQPAGGGRFYNSFLKKNFVLIDGNEAAQVGRAIVPRGRPFFTDGVPLWAIPCIFKILCMKI